MTNSLDIAVLLDCTGSMGGVINSFKRDLKRIFESLCASDRCSTVRMALVKFRDHPPQDATFVTEVHNFTSDVAVMQRLIDDCQPTGGGDGPEAITDAMYEAVESISWSTESKKVVVLCTDAEPHGVGAAGDSMPDGCPAGHDPIMLAKQMAERAITFITMSTCMYGTMALAGMCFITGGRYISYDPNSGNAALCETMVGLILEDYQIESLMTSIHAELAAEADKMGTSIDEQELTRRMKQLLDSRGILNETVINSGISGNQQFEDLGESIERYLTFENVRQVRDYIEGLRRGKTARSRTANPRRGRAATRRRVAKAVARKRPAKKEELKPAKAGVRRSLRLQFKADDVKRPAPAVSASEPDESSEKPGSASEGDREPDEIRRIVRKTIARRKAGSKK